MFATPKRVPATGSGLDPATLRVLQAAKSSGKLAIRNVTLQYVPAEIWDFDERTFDQGSGKRTDWWESERLARLHLENCDLAHFASRPPTPEAPPSYELITERLGSLQALHVTHNERLQQWPLATFRLPCLQDLDLSFNAIEAFEDDPVSRSLGNLQEDDVIAPLRTLSLHHNRLASLAPLRMLMLIDSPLASSLTRLLLHDNCLESLPPQLLNLSSLSVLSLAKNSITALPEKLGQRLTNLRELDVSENLLTCWPQSMVLLTKLERLNLRANRIVCAEPTGLPAVSDSVKELFLGDNRITQVLGLQHCRSLATLDLSDNRLERLLVLGAQDLGASSFPVLPLHECWPKLQRLDVHNNALQQLPLELGLLEGLTALQLHGNRLPVHVQEMPSRELVAWVRKRATEESSPAPTFAGERQGGKDYTVSEGNLDISNTKLEALPVGLFTNETNGKHLRVLAAAKNKLTAVPLQVGLLRVLQQLDLSNNGLTAIPKELGACSKLEDVNFSSNKLSEVPNEAFAALTRLKVVNLAANAFGSGPVLLHGLAASGSSLMHLSLGHNRLAFEQIDFDSIVKHLTELKHLDLNTNALKSLPGALATLVHLTMLDVQFNELAMVPIELRQKTKPVDRRNPPLRLLAYGNLRPESSLLRVPPQ